MDKKHSTITEELNNLINFMIGRYLKNVTQLSIVNKLGFYLALTKYLNYEPNPRVLTVSNTILESALTDIMKNSNLGGLSAIQDIQVILLFIYKNNQNVDINNEIWLIVYDAIRFNKIIYKRNEKTNLAGMTKAGWQFYYKIAFGPKTNKALYTLNTQTLFDIVENISDQKSEDYKIICESIRFLCVLSKSGFYPKQMEKHIQKKMEMLHVIVTEDVFFNNSIETGSVPVFPILTWLTTIFKNLHNTTLPREILSGLKENFDFTERPTFLTLNYGLSYWTALYNEIWRNSNLSIYRDIYEKCLSDLLSGLDFQQKELNDYECFDIRNGLSGVALTLTSLLYIPENENFQEMLHFFSC